MINTSTLVPTGSSRIPDWVSGGSYVVNDQVMSPITFLAYVRKTNGGGVTDPSADGTNWTPFGMAKKQTIRGVISIVTPNLSNTATISSVVTANCKVSFLGVTHTSTFSGGRVELTNSTTVTAYLGTNGAGSGTVGYEITEYY